MFPDSNLTQEVQDPAQAWYALTVGAFTAKTRIDDTTLSSYQAVAEAGDLSPFSTTSVIWPARRWPIKPEILFEGGNVAVNSAGSVLDPDDLKLISTYRDPQIAQFSSFEATSVAAAQAANMAAQLQVAYPEAWPETVRALMVHSAEWTDTQLRNHLRGTKKSDYANLARIFGYGVPDLDRAISCAQNSLCLIAEETIQPFEKHATQSRYISRDMHIYQLPWPSAQLANLGELPVQMRVTLSYFIEPSPGEVGWKDRYHSDIWTGTAADLASSNLIAIHPAVGWWRERHHLGKFDKQTRYSLVVSVSLPD